MKRFLRILPALLCFMCLLTATAFADVAEGVVYATAVAVPVIFIAIAVIIAAVLIWLISRRRKK